MSDIKPCRLPTLVGALCISSSLLADGDLERVLVTAQRAEIDAAGVPVSVAVIDREAIEASTARHVVDLLRGTGGIQVSDLFGDGSQARIDMRGFGPTAANATLVMVDGRRLNNPDLGAPDLNSIALKDVERIEVLQGSAATLYGDQAVGGVVNVVTREPREFSAGVELDYGAFNRRALRARAANAHDNGLSWRLSAERRQSDNYRDFNEQHYANVFARVGWTHARGEVFAELGFVDEDLQTPGALFLDQVRADRRQAQNPADFVNTDTRSLRLGLRQQLLPDWTLLAEYTQRSSDSDGQLSFGGFPNGLQLKRQHAEWTPRLVGSLPFLGEDASITIGADIMRTDYRLFSDVGVTLDDQEQFSVYARASLPLSDTLVLTLGARHADVNNALFASTSFLGVSLPAGTRIDDDANAAEIGLAWQFRDGWRAFARVESNFRFANADEYSGIANFNVFPFPAPLPVPTTQTGVSWDLGVEWRGDATALTLVGYRLDIDDEIGFEPSSGQNFNIGDSRRYGFNLSGRWQPLEGLHLSGSYAFIDGEMTSGRFDGRDITFAARHSGRVQAHYAHRSGLSLASELVAVDERVLAGDFDNALSALPGYAVVNARVGYRWQGVSVNLSVNNLLDKRYSDAGASGFDFRDPFFPVVATLFPAPDRNLMLSVGYSL